MTVLPCIPTGNIFSVFFFFPPNFFPPLSPAVFSEVMRYKLQSWHLTPASSFESQCLNNILSGVHVKG